MTIGPYQRAGEVQALKEVLAANPSSELADVWEGDDVTLWPRVVTGDGSAVTEL